MAINNEELMQKFVRTGMIMRHIDGEGPCPHKHGPHGHGPMGYPGAQEARFEMGPDAEHPHGPHGHGPGERPFDGPECHSHVPGHGPGYGHGRGRHGKHRRGQARVLSMVAMQEGINQKDLAFLLGIRPQTLGEMLRKLEERGFIERKKSEVDGRAIEVTLTDVGRERANEIAERRKLAAADMFAVLSDEEKEQLSAILDKLGDELDKHRPKRGCKRGEEPEVVQA